MSNYIVLPKTAASAKAKFSELLTDQSLTKLLVFGDDDTARNAKKFARSLSESGHADYTTVVFIEAGDITPLLPALQELDIAEGLTLRPLNDDTAISISAGNIIAYILSKARFNQAPGWMNRAILEALAF